MTTFILIFFGLVFIGLSICFFYINRSNISEHVSNDTDELSEGDDFLNSKLEDKVYHIEVVDEYILNSKQHKKIIEQNVPIVEISSNDLSEDESASESNQLIKVHKLMYHHQLRFYLSNVGKNSLKDVIFSIQDEYSGGQETRKNDKSFAKNDYLGKEVDNEEMGMYQNYEINTLNLKTKKLVYTSNLPESFGTGEYSYHIVVEWNLGFYQMLVKIVEQEGKLKYSYEFYDVEGKSIHFKNSENSVVV